MSGRFSYIVLIIILAFTLRLVNLGKPSLILDENIYATGSYYYNIFKKANFVNIPWNIAVLWNMGGARAEFYYFAIMMSFLIFGENDFAVRLPPAIMGSLSIPMIYLISKKVFDRNEKAALFSSILLAVDGYHVYFSRVAWADVSAAFFLLCSTFLFLNAIENPSKIKPKEVFLAVFVLWVAFFFKRTAVFIIVVWVLFLLFAPEYGRHFLRQYFFKPLCLLFILIGLITVPFNILMWLHRGCLESEIEGFILLRGYRMLNPLYILGGTITFLSFLLELSGPLSVLYILSLSFHFLPRLRLEKFEVRSFISKVTFVEWWFLVYFVMLTMIGPGAKHLQEKVFDFVYIVLNGVGGYAPQIYVLMILPLVLLSSSFLSNLFSRIRDNRVRFVLLCVVMVLLLHELYYVINNYVSGESDFSFYRRFDVVNFPAWYKDYGFNLLRKYLVETYGDVKQNILFIVDDDILTFQWWWYLRGFDLIFSDELVRVLEGDTHSLRIYVMGRPYPPVEVVSISKLAMEYSQVLLVIKSESIPRTKTGQDDALADALEKELVQKAEFVATIKVYGKDCFHIYKVNLSELTELTAKTMRRCKHDFYRGLN